MYSTSTVGAALLLGLAAIARADDNFGGYGFSSSAVNISARSVAWERAYNSSNATGTITFTGYDVSLPWPGKPLDGWTVSATGVDLSKLDDALRAEGKRRVIGDDVRIVAPSSLYKQSGNSSDAGRPVVNVHADWVFCAWPWYLPPAGNNSLQNNPDNLPQKPDGSCGQWLTDSCITALENAAKTAYEFSSLQGTWGQRHKCKSLDVPSACRSGYMSRSQPITDRWGAPLKYLNGSSTFQDGYSLDNRYTPEDQKAMWKTITHSYRPILTLFGRSKSDPNAKVEPGFAKLVCLRAQEKGEVNEPASQGTNGSNGSGGKNSATGVSTSWVLLLTMVAAIMALH